MKVKLSVLLPVVAFILSNMFAWISGFDYNERGQEAATVFGLVMFVTLVGFIFGFIFDFDPNRPKMSVYDQIKDPPSQP